MIGSRRAGSFQSLEFFRLTLAYMHNHAYIAGMTTKEAAARAAILKAVAHPARIILLEALKDDELCVNDLCELLDVDQSVVSRHLAQLKRAGIVSERREGVKIIHRLACPCILQALECTVGVMKSELRQKNAALGGRKRK